MGLFGFTRADDAPVDDEVSADDLLLTASVTSDDAEVTRDQAMAIPAFAACVGTISDTFAALPVRLYRRDGNAVREVRGDPRTAMLNGDSGDTMTGPEIKKAMAMDFLCSSGGGHLYVDKARYSNRVRSLRYVKPEDCSCVELGDPDPIFKTKVYLVGARQIEPWQMIHVLRASRNGRRGLSIVEQNAQALSVAWETMVYERGLVKRGGNKRGYLMSAKRLGKSALKALKKAWHSFFNSAGDQVLVLNEGVEFKEATTTSTEMQLAENKKVNASEIYSMFQMPPEILTSGSTDGASKNARENYSRFCIIPIAAQFEAEYDRCLLLEGEKGAMFFKIDLSELTKGDPKERWEVHKLKKESGFETIDEARREENMEPFGIDYLNLGLNDVLLDPEKRTITIPNMGKTVSLDDLPVSNQAEEPAAGAYPAPTQTGGGEDNGRDDQSR